MTLWEREESGARSEKPRVQAEKDEPRGLERIKRGNGVAGAAESGGA